MTLRDIVARVNDWAAWTARLESSGLGYPSRTAESRTTGGSKRQPGPIVPNVVMNPWAVEVDRAIREMPPEMRNLLCHKHLSSVGTTLELAREYAATHSMSLSTYYRVEKDAYWFIGGFLATNRQRARQ